MGIHYKPYEQRSLDSLVGALDHGLDPTMGLQLFQQTQGGALDRMAQNRQLRQQALAGISDSLSQTAAANPDPMAGQALIQGLSQSLPGLNGPHTQGKLDDLLNSFYPQGASGASPLYQPPPGADPLPTAGLDAEDKAALGSQLLDVYNTAPGEAATLYKMRETARNTAISVGLDPSSIEDAQTYAEQVFAQLSGRPYSDVNQMGRPGFSWEQGAGASPTSGPVVQPSGAYSAAAAGYRSLLDSVR